MDPARNVLFITLDQFRADCLSCAGHPVVRTPHLDDLAAEGVRLARHYAQAAPCAPGPRRAVHGHVPDEQPRRRQRHAARRPLRQRRPLAGRAGYAPALFGYTDQGVDPRLRRRPRRPAAVDVGGRAAGVRRVLDLIEDHRPWLEWLGELGYTTPSAADPDSVALALLATERERPAEHSVSTFLTDALLAWIDGQDEPWFAHASYLRPHPPYTRPASSPRCTTPPTARHRCRSRGGATRCTTWC